MTTDLSQARSVWPVPARFRNTTPKQWAVRGRQEYPEEWLLIRNWLIRFPHYLRTSPDPDLIGRGLLVTGPAGTGKTMLASGCANWLGDRGYSVCFVRDGDLARLLRANFLPDEDEERLYLLYRAACVVVDDMLRGGGESQLLEPFLRYRMDEGKPTILTGNNEVTLSSVMSSLMHEYAHIDLLGVDNRTLLRGKADW